MILYPLFLCWVSFALTVSYVIRRPKDLGVHEQLTSDNNLILHVNRQLDGEDKPAFLELTPAVSENAEANKVGRVVLVPVSNSATSIDGLPESAASSSSTKHKVHEPLGEKLNVVSETGKAESVKLAFSESAVSKAVIDTAKTDVTSGSSGSLSRADILPEFVNLAPKTADSFSDSSLKVNAALGSSLQVVASASVTTDIEEGVVTTAKQQQQKQRTSTTEDIQSSSSSNTIGSVESASAPSQKKGPEPLATTNNLNTITTSTTGSEIGTKTGTITAGAISGNPSNAGPAFVDIVPKTVDHIPHTDSKFATSDAATIDGNAATTATAAAATVAANNMLAIDGLTAVMNTVPKPKQPAVEFLALSPEKLPAEGSGLSKSPSSSSFSSSSLTTAQVPAATASVTSLTKNSRDDAKAGATSLSLETLPQTTTSTAAVKRDGVLPADVPKQQQQEQKQQEFVEVVRSSSSTSTSSHTDAAVLARESASSSSSSSLLTPPPPGGAVASLPVSPEQKQASLVEKLEKHLSKPPDYVDIVPVVVKPSATSTSTSVSSDASSNESLLAVVSKNPAAGTDGITASAEAAAALHISSRSSSSDMPKTVSTSTTSSIASIGDKEKSSVKAGGADAPGFIDIVPLPAPPTPPSVPDIDIDRAVKVNKADDASSHQEDSSKKASPSLPLLSSSDQSITTAATLSDRSSQSSSSTTSASSVSTANSAASSANANNQQLVPPQFVDPAPIERLPPPATDSVLVLRPDDTTAAAANVSLSTTANSITVDSSSSRSVRPASDTALATASVAASDHNNLIVSSTSSGGGSSSTSSSTALTAPARNNKESSEPQLPKYIIDLSADTVLPPSNHQEGAGAGQISESAMEAAAAIATTKLSAAISINTENNSPRSPSYLRGFNGAADKNSNLLSISSSSAAPVSTSTTSAAAASQVDATVNKELAAAAVDPEPDPPIHIPMPQPPQYDTTVVADTLNSESSGGTGDTQGVGGRSSSSATSSNLRGAVTIE